MIALNTDPEVRNLWNDRKSCNETVAELTAPDAIRELISLPIDALRDIWAQPRQRRVR